MVTTGAAAGLGDGLARTAGLGTTGGLAAGLGLGLGLGLTAGEGLTAAAGLEGVEVGGGDGAGWQATRNKAPVMPSVERRAVIIDRRVNGFSSRRVEGTKLNEGFEQLRRGPSRTEPYT
jgi:hypothetical protein